LVGVEILRGFIKQSASSASFLLIISPHLESIYSTLARYLAKYGDRMGSESNDSKSDQDERLQRDKKERDELRKLRRLFSESLICTLKIMKR
jgi:hypothetical protein